MSNDHHPAMPPPRNQWVRITFTDGSVSTYRFVSTCRLRLNPDITWWQVDRGRYGKTSSDAYIPETRIVSVTPTEKPKWLLTITDPMDGRKCRVGRFATQEEANGHINEIYKLLQPEISIAP